LDQVVDLSQLDEKERSLLVVLHDFPQVIKLAGDQFSPALVANFAYDVAKEFNQFYHALVILKEENETRKIFRLQLAFITARTLQQSMRLLGIEVPERM